MRKTPPHADRVCMRFDHKFRPFWEPKDDLSFHELRFIDKKIKKNSSAWWVKSSMHLFWYERSMRCNLYFLMLTTNRVKIFKQAHSLLCHKTYEKLKIRRSIFKTCIDLQYFFSLYVMLHQSTLTIYNQLFILYIAIM